VKDSMKNYLKLWMKLEVLLQDKVITRWLKLEHQFGQAWAVIIQEWAKGSMMI
jgi:hypothetical protein